MGNETKLDLYQCETIENCETTEVEGSVYYKLDEGAVLHDTNYNEMYVGDEAGHAQFINDVGLRLRNGETVLQSSGISVNDTIPLDKRLVIENEDDYETYLKGKLYPGLEFTVKSTDAFTTSDGVSLTKGSYRVAADGTSIVRSYTDGGIAAFIDTQAINPEDQTQNQKSYYISLTGDSKGGPYAVSSRYATKGLFYNGDSMAQSGLHVAKVWGDLHGYADHALDQEVHHITPRRTNLEALNDLANTGRSVDVRFTPSETETTPVNIAGMDFPNYSQGFLASSAAGKTSDAVLLTVGLDGIVRTAFRANGTWNVARDMSVARRVTGSQATASKLRRVWFSASDDDTERVYNDNFLYNPSGTNGNGTLRIGTIDEEEKFHGGTVLASRFEGSAAKSDRMVSTVLSTDILAKALEVAKIDNGVWSFYLSGTNYQMENGQYKNLPSENSVYGKALVLTRYESPTVILSSGVDKSIYYNSYVNKQWTGWQTVINSSNIANQSVSHADEADHADHADSADNADRIEGRALPAVLGDFLAYVRGLGNGVYHYDIPSNLSQGLPLQGPCMATVYNYENSCTVMLWGSYAGAPLYRNSYDSNLNGGSWRGWEKLITSANIGSQTVSKAGLADKATDATNDASGNNIEETYGNFSRTFKNVSASFKLEALCTYEFYVALTNESNGTLRHLTWSAIGTVQTQGTHILLGMQLDGTYFILTLEPDKGPVISKCVVDLDEKKQTVVTPFNPLIFKYRQIY